MDKIKSGAASGMHTLKIECEAARMIKDWR